MFLQEAPPDTLNYLLLGYAILFGLPLLFILSLWWRQRNLEKDLDVLEEMEKR
jgi:hypothetical protein